MKNKVKYKYIFDDSYNPLYVNGAQGGINPGGEIIINFYLERMALPNSQTVNIKDGKLTNTVSDVEPNDLDSSFVRVVKNGVVMNYQTAKEIHKWLGDHIANLEKIAKQNEKS